MILERFRNKFLHLKSKGINIQYVLDIGAYRGDFTETIHSVWSSAIVKQFEADERQKPFLQQNAYITLLGNTDGDVVNYYTIEESDSISSTGSSIFKELTHFYTDKTTIIKQKETITIDTLDSKYNFFGNWKDYGLVKLDTQGSELLILEGASSFLKKKIPRFILIECSWTQYNDGSPLLVDVINYLDKLDYRAKDIFDASYDNNGNLIQTDILFERK